MKNFKFKFWTFTLVLISSTMIFFTSCEKEDISDDNSQVDFINIEFDNETVTTLDGNDTARKLITLDGKFDVSPSGNVSGKVLVNTLDNLITGEVEIINSNMIYATAEGSVTLNLNTMGNLVIDKYGVTTTVDLSTITDQITSIESNYNPNDLEYRAVYAFLAVFQNDAWAINASTSKLISNSGRTLRGCSWWQNTIAYGAGAAVVALGAVGCGSLTAGCGAGTVVTLGTLSVPCGVAIGACAAATWGGTAAAVSVIKNWLCEDDECFSPNNISSTYHGNNLHCLSYNAPNGGTTNAYWYNFSTASWVYFHSTTSESFCVYASSGLYIGLSSNCSNGTATVIQNSQNWVRL